MTSKISSLFEEPPEARSKAVTQRMAENSRILGGRRKCSFSVLPGRLRVHLGSHNSLEDSFSSWLSLEDWKNVVC